MSVFSYNSSDPSSARDQVRMHLGDVDGSVTTGPRDSWSIYLTDGEIDALLSGAGNVVLLAAARGADIMARRYLATHPDVKLGQFATSSTAATHWRELAKSLYEQAEIDGGFAVAPMAWTEDSAAEVADYKLLRGENN